MNESPLDAPMTPTVSPGYSESLSSILSYHLLDSIYRGCEQQRSKDRDPSVTTYVLRQAMGGLDEWQIQLRLKPLSVGPEALVETKPEGMTWRVRITRRGLELAHHLQQVATDRHERFLTTIEGNLDRLSRLTAGKYKDSAAIASGIATEVARIVRSDLGKTVALLKKLHEMPKTEMSGARLDSAWPALDACVSLQNHLLHKGGGEGDESETAAECMREYITDVAQREIIAYLIDQRYWAFLADLRRRWPEQRPRIAVMDLNVAIACLGSCDALSVMVNESLAIYKALKAEKGAEFKWELMLPANAQYALEEKLEWVGQEYEQLRVVWKPDFEFDTPPRVRQILERLSAFSLFREFIFNWRSDDFNAFSRRTMAAFRRLAMHYGLVGSADRVPLPQYDGYLRDLVREAERQSGKVVIVWTFDERLGRQGIAIDGPALPIMLDPERLTEMRRTEEELGVLGSLRWWQDRMVTADRIQFRRGVTKELLARLGAKYANRGI